MKATRQGKFTKETFLWNETGHEILQYFQILNSVCFALLHYEQHLHLVNTIGKFLRAEVIIWAY